MDPKFSMQCPTKDMDDVLAIAEFLAKNNGEVKESNQFKEHD